MEKKLKKLFEDLAEECEEHTLLIGQIGDDIFYAPFGKTKKRVMEGDKVDILVRSGRMVILGWREDTEKKNFEFLERHEMLVGIEPISGFNVARDVFNSVPVKDKEAQGE